jgi:protein involved in polysaccharide export with SLBB domain
MKGSFLALRALIVCALFAVFGAQLGCESTSGSGSVQPPTGAGGPPPRKSGVTDTTYHAGDKVIIDFDQPIMPQQWQQVVREDGMITLPMNKSIMAADKQKGELEAEIQKLYVPDLLKRLTVNIRSEERTYFVKGEVRTPGQRPHTGWITATKAIAAAGDFTDFAKKTDIEIIRGATGEIIHMNAKKALKDPKLDIPVFPGDTVHVNRRFF